jgi:predicted phosphoribosyltransferase
MRFKNREEAAKQLAGRLAAYKGQNPLILGVPRGAVPMARTIADALEGHLDIVLVRKLRAPGQPELAIGAVDEAGAVYDEPVIELNREAMRQMHVHVELEIVPGAAHLFEEPGTLDQVADLAAGWFARYLRAGSRRG